MLVPAILFKEEISEKMKGKFYTDDMFYETGSLLNWLPNIQEEPQEGRYDWAIVDSKNTLLGYFTYRIDYYTSCAGGFGLISFDKGNYILGKSVYSIMEKLIHEHKLHRLEWRMIGGNPVERHYDKFCSKYNGNKHILKDATKDLYGNYRDDVIYEIIFNKGGAE